MEMERIINALRDECPPLVSRNEAAKLLGGMLANGTLRNLDSNGGGPSRRVKIGKKSGYFRDDFVSWVQGKLEVQK